ncbi:MAG: hypothetical protein K2N74_02310, partial [Clostridiales bacterium]|nr:hypothetical protein [Clostridiales bacterium]
MKILKRMLGTVLSLCVFLGALAGTVACKNTSPNPINYTITVTCQDEEVLTEVQVQLLLNGAAAAEAKSLNSEHKAVFSLKPETYTVVLGGTDGYTYPETTVTANNPSATIQLTAEATYSVTYSLGSCAGTDYAGNSALPTQTDKKEGAKFNLAAAPVWTDRTFDGWSDGERIYEAGEEYTMPARAVTLTAHWYNYPDGVIKTNVVIPEWDENGTDGDRYTIERGQYIELTASFSGRELADWTGIVGKAYANSINTEGTFYQYRPDFAIRRVKTSWSEDNSGFTVTNTNWDESKYTSLASEGEVKVRYELSEQGVLTYTIEFNSAEYSYKRVFTVKNDKMDKAIVFIGAARCTVSDATIVRPMPEGVKLSFDWGYDNLVDFEVVKENSTYTFGEEAFRDGYLFLGWQVNGEGKYYKSGDTYSVGKNRVRFFAAWEEVPATEGLEFTKLANGTYSVTMGTANAETVIIPST